VSLDVPADLAAPLPQQKIFADQDPLSRRQLALGPLLAKRPQKWRIPLSIHDALNFMFACETRECLAFVLEIVSVVRRASS
jgi:hypothetical protein